MNEVAEAGSASTIRQAMRFDTGSDRFSWRTTMNIKATILASVLGMPLVAGAALAADTGNQSLVTAVKQGRSADVQSILNSEAKREIVATQGGAALISAASHNNKEMVDLLL